MQWSISCDFPVLFVISLHRLVCKIAGSIPLLWRLTEKRHLTYHLERRESKYAFLPIFLQVCLLLQTRTLLHAENMSDVHWIIIYAGGNICRNHMPFGWAQFHSPYVRLLLRSASFPPSDAYKLIKQNYITILNSRLLTPWTISNPSFRA